MRTYVNRYSDVLLPFTQPVPFPIGCISHISLCIPTQQSVYVASIVSTKNNFMLSVSTVDSAYSCSFVYKGNLLIQSTAENNMFGMLILSHIPQQEFSYTGQWQIHKRYIQTIRDIKGYKTIQVNGKQYTAPKALSLEFAGAVQVSGDTVHRQAGLTFGMPAYNTSYVSSVNDTGVQNLFIASSDSSLIVSQPIVNRDTVTVYINTTEQFPTCEN